MDRREHLLVAGTGRSGTSFVVRYLTGLGMDTHLSRRGADAGWYEEANAGLEDTPLIDPASMPDVIKSPWSYEFVTELLGRDDIGLRAAIVPIRDLGEVAVSRSILERQAIHARAEWMVLRDTPYETWGYTPGGIVFSLAVADQARLLAVGFHHLVEQLVAAEVPIAMPLFPRMIEDADYLFRVLRPFLPDGIDAATARAVHAEIADASKVRVRSPRAEASTDHAPPESELDREAMRRELVRVREAARATTDRADVAEAELGRVRRELEFERSRARPARAARATGPGAWLTRLRRSSRSP